jgi:hypothetical protein
MSAVDGVLIWAWSEERLNATSFLLRWSLVWSGSCAKIPGAPRDAPILPETEMVLLRKGLSGSPIVARPTAQGARIVVRRSSGLYI